jgi:hypothetical protein
MKVGVVFIACIFTPLTWAAPPSRSPAPGLLNASTGHVRINGTEADTSTCGRAVLEVGGKIETRSIGMAELLLSPGSFLRVGAGSAVLMEPADTTSVRLQVLRGRVLVDVLSLQSPIQIDQSSVTGAIEAPGLYGFDAAKSLIAVYSGRANLSNGARRLTAEKGVAVATRGFRKISFVPDPAEPLMAWSRLRSAQLSGESAARAQAGATESGWQWDPWAVSWTWPSASGAVTGPFGWPYYSSGYTPNAIRGHRGDVYLYGPPVIEPPPISPPAGQRYGRPAPTVNLTVPGIPQFPNNKY